MIEIKGYELLEELYNSSNSLIYRAKPTDHSQNKDTIILKILKENFPSPHELSNYHQEFKITSSNLKEGIIKSFDMIKYNEKHIIIFEDIGGISLNKFLKNHIIDIKSFFDIAIKTTEYLFNIHDNNIIHKDINPANIIINPITNQLKIIDFGISTLLSEENFSYNNINILEGTLAYMSPEQTGRMNRTLDYRTDFYSLGLTFYELLTSKKLFFSQDPLELIHFHLARDPVIPDEIKNKIPEILCNIILKLISKNPEDRYQSALGIKYDLERCYAYLFTDCEKKTFILGENDISNRFCISKKLYGREKQLSILFKTFEKVQNGNTESILVSGYSGIGKTSLIQKLYKPILKTKSFFCKGKFEQFQRHIPYSAISQACSELIKNILSETNESLEEWKVKIKTALGINAKIITDLIPDLEKIIGQQENVTELNPTESINRFQLTFINFLKVFTSANSPVVFFLDDLQWSDVASLNLIQNILISKDINYFFLLGAYRDNEVDVKHTLTVTLNNLRDYIDIVTIHLDPLSETLVNDLISDTFNINDISITLPLSKLIFEKTNGNPFFINELLKTLYQKRIVKFDSRKNIWEWNNKEVVNLDISDNVINLVLEKFKKCSNDAIELLKITSCFGNNFSLSNLTLLIEKPIINIINALREVIEIGAIIPKNHTYNDIQFITDKDISSWLLKSEYKYQHDKVQQAAYMLKTERSQEFIHLSIGRLMLNKLSEIEIENKIIEIVQHLNKGILLLDNDNEKIELANLNFRAGNKAKSSAAYIPALEFFSQGISTLPESSWETNYRITYDLYRSVCDSAYICGEFEIAESYSQIIISKAKSIVEKVEIYYLQGIQYTTILKLEGAIDVIRKGLSLLGLHIDKDYTIEQVLQESELVSQNLKQRDINNIINEPEITDQKNKLIIKLLQGILLPAYTLGLKNLISFCILKGVNHNLKFGLSPESAYMFNGYALLIGHYFENLKMAYPFGELALALNERFNDPKYKAVNLFTNIVFIQYWNKPPKEFVESYKKTIETGLETGELMNTAYSCNNITQWDWSLTLEKALEYDKAYFKIVKSIRFQASIDIGYIFHNLRLNFVGKTNELFSLNTENFNEESTLLRLKETQSYLVLAIYHIYKIQPYFHYENYDLALEHINEAETLSEFLTGQAHLVDFNLFSFLTYTAIYNEKNDIEKKLIYTKIEKSFNQICIWSDNMPDNFEHLKFLMMAELEKLNGNFLKADDLYQKSINLSIKYSFLQHQAIAYEMAGKLWLNADKPDFANLYLKKARYAYEIWGATQKINDMDKKYPFLFVNKSGKLDTTITNNSNISLVNIETMIKSSQAILTEKNMSILLEKMLKFIIENAGAEKGIFVLPKEDGWSIEAEYNINTNDLCILQSKPIESDDNIPKSIIYYTIRTGENLVCNNVQTEERFINDPYIVKNKPLSVLCMPLINQGNVQGILYLENNLTTDAFTEKHLEILNLLSIQAAISLENNILYAELEKRVNERTNDLLIANSNLETINNEKNELLNIVTHNLKSPLSSILGFASAINTIPDLNKNEIISYSSQILSGSRRMLKMIEDLLDINAIEQGNYKIYPENMDIIPFVQDLILNYTEQLNSKKLTLKLITDKEQFIVFVDDAWLAQILDNLISNAIKFSQIGKNITIKLEQINNRKRIYVIDEGPGITESDQKKLFKKFVRLSATPTFGESSSGLGLSIVKKLVDILGYKVYCESIAGNGATFIIEF